MSNTLIFLVFNSVLLFLVLLLLILQRKKISSTPEFNFKGTFEAIWKIEKAVLETLDLEKATGKVVNIILTQLGYINYGYEVIVLTLLDTEKQHLKRIAISQTAAAERFIKATPIPFQDIIIPLSAQDNLSVKAINDHKMYVTSKVANVLYPALSREWVEDFQKQLGIKASIVFPILAKDKILGTLIFSLSKEQDRISDYEWIVLDSFVGSVGIALDNALLFRSVKETGEELRFANERLLELDHLKDEFVSLASHELRTPMTIIKSYLWFLLEGKKGTLSDEQKKYVETAYLSTERLINLVNDMLNVSRIESGRLTVAIKPTNISELIDKIIVGLLPRATELKLSLVYKRPDVSFPLVAADPERVEQILINLIGNSLKFTPEGGIISVDLENAGDKVITRVSDTGRGIKAEDIPKLFQKFGMVGDSNFLTRQSIQGTGLGLYLSKALISLMKGTITVSSAGEGKGTAFTFSLPAATASGALKAEE